MSYKNPLITNTYEMAKEGINDMETKPNLVKEAITYTIAKINDTQSTK